jgi:DNA-binding MarR family transcriptional regulator
MAEMDGEPISRDDERLRTWVALLRAQSAVVDAVETELLSRHGLPLSWHEVMVRLDRSPDGAMRMQELAREVLLSKSGLTRLADRMEEAGLIERSKCGTDRRGTFAVITEAGRQMLRESFPAFTAAVDEHFARHLSPDELSSLRSLLTKVLEGAGQPEDDGCSPADAALEPVGQAEPQPVH